MNRVFRFSSLLTLLTIAAALSVQAQDVSIFASGLNGPRGLKFGPDGALYVAEAGLGGTNGPFNCEQVPAPVGPYHGGLTARISKITGPGQVTTVVDGLPSTISALPSGDTDGVGDVAFVGDTLYALLAGGGCSHGNPDYPNGVIRVDVGHSTWSYVADLSAFQKANPVVNPDLDDFEPDGVWYSMVAVRGAIYAIEPNHGELDMITTDVQVRRIVDISAVEGHIVPTSVSYHGNFYVGNLNTFPIEVGTSQVLKITPSGQISTAGRGFTTVVGVAFDQHKRMYVLELSDAPGFPSPGAGKVVRVNPSGQTEDIVTGLVVPTALTIGPDNALYISNFGAAPPGLGQILRVKVSN